MGIFVFASCQCLIEGKYCFVVNKGNSNVTQTLYLHVHRFEALPSIICIGISRGQVIKVLRHENVVLQNCWKVKVKH